MGIGPFRSTSSCKTDSYGNTEPAKPGSVDPKFGNPDPRHFKILHHAQFGQAKGKIATVVEVSYPDAKNYEGRKVMVYRCSFETVERQEYLDPHFCDDASHVAPFARFEPTEAGWKVACLLAEAMAR